MEINSCMSPSMLPDETIQTMDFKDSSFFKTGLNRRLPTPDEVKALSSDVDTHPEPKPIKFENLGLIVKFGQYVTVEEALCLWAIQRRFGAEVPVPEIYGWRVDGPFVFLYMQLIPGETLKDRWAALKEDEIEDLCSQLERIMKSLREIRQDPADPFVGSINRKAPADYVFRFQPKIGAFNSVKVFNDWFFRLPFGEAFEKIQDFGDFDRSALSDGGPITFTHADMHRSNIIVSSESPPRVLAIVDWALSGWYPDYWEYCKACYTSSFKDPWRYKWFPKFIQPRLPESETFGQLVMAMGAV